MYVTTDGELSILWKKKITDSKTQIEWQYGLHADVFPAFNEQYMVL